MNKREKEKKTSSDIKTFIQGPPNVSPFTASSVE